MDMTAEDNRTIGCHIFGDRDQRCHLRIINHDDMGSSLGGGSEGSFWDQPVALGVLFDPVGDLAVVVCAEAFFGFGDALQDVVVRLGDAEDPWAWFWDVPAGDQHSSDHCGGLITYQATSTPRTWASLTRACLMSATPPPWGVALKKAVLIFRFFKSEA